jgi:hypothetical protein
MTEFDVEDAEAFREALGDLLRAAQENGVPQDSLTGLMTVYLAALRGDVRLPLSVSPERAETFHEQFADNLGETAEFELLVSQDVLDDIDLQLEAFRGDGPVPEE